MRQCSRCRCEDRPEVNPDLKCTCKGDGSILGHTGDCGQVQHYVVRQIKPFAQPLTRKMRDQGWRERPPFQGKVSIERFICRMCRIKEAEIESLRAHMQKLQKREAAEPTLYQILSY